MIGHCKVRSIVQYVYRTYVTELAYYGKREPSAGKTTAQVFIVPVQNKTRGKDEIHKGWENLLSFT